MYRFEKENQDLFIALASILNTKGADVEMRSDFDHFKEHKEIKYTNVPYIGSGHYMGDAGFYFRAKRDFFGLSLEQIRDSFTLESIVESPRGARLNRHRSPPSSAVFNVYVPRK